MGVICVRVNRYELRIHFCYQFFFRLNTVNETDKRNNKKPLSGCIFHILINLILFFTYLKVMANKFDEIENIYVFIFIYLSTHFDKINARCLLCAFAYVYGSAILSKLCMQV